MQPQLVGSKLVKAQSTNSSASGRSKRAVIEVELHGKEPELITETCVSTPSISRKLGPPESPHRNHFDLLQSAEMRA